jgi:hypothetical protein
MEVLYVGIAAAIVGIIISTALMYVSKKDFSLKEYSFWPQIALSFFLTGALLHLIFEVAGLNKYYCKHGNACL